MDNLFRGDNLQLWIFENSGATSGKCVAYGTSCSFSVNSEAVQASSKYSCSWANSEYGNRSYTISSDALYSDRSGTTTYDTLLQKQINGEPVGWLIGPEDDKPAATDCDDFTHPYTSGATDQYYMGVGIITDLQLTAATNEFANFSMTLTGNGEPQLVKGNNISNPLA